MYEANQATIQKMFALSQQAVSKLKEIESDWIRWEGKRIKVDIESDGFKFWLNGLKNDSLSNKVRARKRVLKRRKDTVQNKTSNKKRVEDDILEDEDVQKLQKLSIQADLSESIVKLELQKYKVETEKLKLKKNASELIQFSLAEYLFFGYLERVNIEKLTFPKKIAPQIEQIISEEILQKAPPELKKELSTLISLKQIANKVVNLVIREEEEILHSIKKSQKDEVSKWISEQS